MDGSCNERSEWTDRCEILGYLSLFCWGTLSLDLGADSRVFSLEYSTLALRVDIGMKVALFEISICDGAGSGRVSSVRFARLLSC